MPSSFGGVAYKHPILGTQVDGQTLKALNEYVHYKNTTACVGTLVFLRFS